MPTPAVLNISTVVVAFGDTPQTSNPKRKYFDWQRSAMGVPVTNPKSEQFTIQPRDMVAIFDSSRAVTLDSTTRFDIKHMGDSRYRFLWTGGTDPSLEANIPLTFTGTQIAVAIQSNQTVKFTSSAGTPFHGIEAGHTVYIYGTNDGVTGAFNPANAGRWRVVLATDTVLTLARFSGHPFNAADETVTCDAVGNMIAFSAADGIAVGDKVRIEGGFAADTCRAYSVVDVTSKWFDVICSIPLAEETNIAPGVTGMLFYSSAKQYMRVEVDQEAKLYVNGASDDAQVITPFVPGDPEGTGWCERTGPVWRLYAYNRSQEPMTVSVFTCE